MNGLNGMNSFVNSYIRNNLNLKGNLNGKYTDNEALAKVLELSARQAQAAKSSPAQANYQKEPLDKRIKECVAKLELAKQEYQTKLQQKPQVAPEKREELAKQLAMRAQVNHARIQWKTLNFEQKKLELAKLDGFDKLFAHEIATQMEKGIRGYHCAFTISTITRAPNDYQRDVLAPLHNKVKKLEAEKLALDGEKNTPKAESNSSSSNSSSSSSSSNSSSSAPKESDKKEPQKRDEIDAKIQELQNQIKKLEAEKSALKGEKNAPKAENSSSSKPQENKPKAPSTAPKREDLDAKIKECGEKLEQAHQEYRIKLQQKPEVAVEKREELAKQLAMRAQVNHARIQWKTLNLEQKKTQLATLGEFERLFAQDIAAQMEKGIRGYHDAFTISIITRAPNDYQRDVLVPLQNKIKQLQAAQVSLISQKQQLEEAQK